MADMSGSSNPAAGATCSSELAGQVLALFNDVIADHRGKRNTMPEDNPTLELDWEVDGRVYTAVLFEGELHTSGWDHACYLDDFTGAVQERIDTAGLSVRLESYARYATFLTQVF